MTRKSRKGKGWPNEPTRHSLASQGIKTSRDSFKELPEYGGMKSFGGLNSYNEYLVGIGNIFENLHCILGATPSEDYEGMENYIGSKIRHMEEEVDKIKYALNEYSKDIYLEPYEEGGVFRKEEEMLKDLREKLPKIEKRAKRGLDLVMKSDLPYELKDVARSTYHMYITLCSELRGTLHGGIDVDENIFENRNVNEAFKDVKRAVNNLEEKYD